jgi:hypothetical protein
VDPRDPLPPQPTLAEIQARRARRRREELRRRRQIRRRRATLLGGIAAIVVLIVIATSGGGTSHNGAAAAKTPPKHAAHYDWVESFDGSPASLEDENKKTGTTSWQLRGGLRRGHIAAYVGEESIRPGSTQRIYVDAPRSRWIRAEVYRMGWYGGRGGRLVLASHKLKPRTQPSCPHDSTLGTVYCTWHPNLSFPIPPGLPSGVYVVKVTSSGVGETYALFVVESTKPLPLLVQMPTATYQAYNEWGGDSLYPSRDVVGVTGTNQGVEVSFDRPYQTSTGAGQLFDRDLAMIRFIEREGYDASYTTGSSVDTDPAQTTGHKMLLDFGHSEYWSQRQVDAFRKARDAGTNIAFLSSNTMVWRVRFALNGHRIVAFKEHVAADPDKSLPSGHLPLAGAPLTGTAWAQCVTPRYTGGAQTHPTYHYYAWKPAASMKPDWLFHDTGFTSSSLVSGIVGYEPDQVSSASPSGTQVIGSGSTLCQHGGPPSGLGQSTLYTAKSGALVFSSGTLGWELGLSPMPNESPDAPHRADPRLVKLTENLFDKMLGG